MSFRYPESRSTAGLLSFWMPLYFTPVMVLGKLPQTPTRGSYLDSFFARRVAASCLGLLTSPNTRLWSLLIPFRGFIVGAENRILQVFRSRGVHGHRVRLLKALLLGF